MSGTKPRAFSANRIPYQTNPIKPKRRYQRILTEGSQSYCQQNTPKLKPKIQSVTKSKIFGRSMIKQPQKIIEQNMNLKVFINDLQYRLSLQRGHLQKNKKTTSKYKKQLNRQFDKEIYYSGKNPNSYMISGVKNQYENMKNLYQEKCLQLQNYIKSVENTEIDELLADLQAFQHQNRLLKQKLNLFMETGMLFQNDFMQKNGNHSRKNMAHKPHLSQVQKLYSYNEQSQNSIAKSDYEEVRNMVAQGKIENNTLLTKIESYKERCKFYESKCKQSEQKVKFLQVLIIQKGNNEHYSNRQIKKVEKQKYQLQIQVKKLKQQISKKEIAHGQKINQVIKRQKQKGENQGNTYRKIIIQKNQMIQQLEKQIRFLSTMLSYWKPLDEINRQFNKDVFKQRQTGKQSQKDQQKRSQSIRIKVNDNFNYRKESSHSELIFNLQVAHNDHQMSFKSNREEQNFRKTGNIRSQSQQNVSSVINEKIPQSCCNKHHENAKKSRKVQLNEIKQYGDLLRYRLIGYRYNISQAKELLNYKKQGEPMDDKSFNLEYISMKQVKDTLKSMPFMLGEQQAILVSRYIVQDSPNQHVYWDEANQIKRSIAKSILKAIIGQYQISNEQLLKKDWQQLKDIYLTNLLIALKVIAPKGIISEKKIVELIVGLGIQLKEQLKDWMIAQMVIKSSSLNELRYNSLLIE